MSDREQSPQTETCYGCHGARYTGTRIVVYNYAYYSRRDRVLVPCQRCGGTGRLPVFETTKEGGEK